MSVFYDKSRDKYVVEVIYKGIRLPKKRFDCQREAKQSEKDWKAGKNLLPIHIDKIKGSLPEAIKPRSKSENITIEELFKDAGYIWSDKKDCINPPMMAQYFAKFLKEQFNHTDPYAEIPLTHFDDFIKISRRDGMHLKPEQRTNGKGVANATINHYMKAFRTAWTFYAKRGQCNPEPWSGYPTLPEADLTEGRLRWMTKAEEKQIIDFFNDRAMDSPSAGRQLKVLAKMVSVSVKTGLRWAELQNLDKWELKTERRNNQNEIHNGKSHGNSHFATLVLNDPSLIKNKQMRSIPISEETFNECHFILDNGGPVTKDCKRFWWRKMKEHMGITDPEFTWHALRHTSATRLVSLGKDIRVIQVFMGHSRIETTLRYAHVSAKNISACVM